MALPEVHRCYSVVIIILNPEENQQVGIVLPSAQARKLRLSLAQCAARDQVAGRQAAPLDCGLKRQRVEGSEVVGRFQSEFGGRGGR